MLQYAYKHKNLKRGKRYEQRRKTYCIYDTETMQR